MSPPTPGPQTEYLHEYYLIVSLLIYYTPAAKTHPKLRNNTSFKQIQRGT